MSDLPETIWATPIDGELWQGTFTDSGKLNADACQYTRTDTIPTWQPIETAPKGESYLAYYPVHDMGRYTLPARITSKAGCHFLAFLNEKAPRNREARGAC